MKVITVSASVAEAAAQIRQTLNTKGFTIFADIDHQANAESVELELAAARTLIFGNPAAGTKLMQKDITMSLDLPMRIAIVDNNGETQVLHQTTNDYTRVYQVEGHPVLEKVEGLFATLASELTE